MKIPLVSGKTFQFSSKVTTPIWTKKVILSTIAMIVTGAMSILIHRTQIQYGFKHSLTQTSICFVGEYLNLITFSIPFVKFKIQKCFLYFLV